MKYNIDLKIPKGKACFGCPYYTYDSRGFNAKCLKYNTIIFNDGFRGIKAKECIKENEN